MKSEAHEMNSGMKGERIDFGEETVEKIGADGGSVPFIKLATCGQVI